MSMELARTTDWCISACTTAVSYAVSTRPRFEEEPSPGWKSGARTGSRPRDVKIDRARTFYRRRALELFRDIDILMLIVFRRCSGVAAPMQPRSPKIARSCHKPPKQIAMIDELARH